jgi:lipopolysaccharide exporter
MNNVSGRLIKGSAWMSASRIVVNVLSLLSTIILARLLVPEDFGIVSLAMTFLAIVTSITELSLSLALVRHAAPAAEHFDTVWTLNALRGLLIGSVFAASGWPLAALYGDERLIGSMAVLGAGTFVAGLTNPRTVLLQRELVFWQEFVLDVTQKLSTFVISLAIAYFYRTYWALLIGFVIGQAASTAVSFVILPYRPRVGFKHFRDLMSFSGWLAGGQIVNTLNWRFEYLLIAQSLGMGPLGHYSVGSNLAQIPTRETTSPLMTVIYPGFATIRNDPQRLAAAYQRAQSLLTAIALPAGFGAALIADPLIRLTMGDKWEPIIFVVQLLAAIFALQTLGSLSTPLAMARGETRLLFQRNVLMLIVRVPLILAGLMMAGLKGIVVARLVSGVFSILVSMQLVQRFTGLGLQQQLAANMRALVSIAAMIGGVVSLAPFLGNESDALSLLARILITGAAGALVYCGTSLALWMAMRKPSGPEHELKLLLSKLLAKLRVA